IRAAECPIAAPSANLFGRPSPTTAKHVLDDLAERIELILDAGPTPIGVESTVLDITRPVPVILRPGGLPREALEAVLGKVEVRTKPVRGPAPSPGMMKRHYAPRVPLKLVIGEDEAVRSFMRKKAFSQAAQGHKVGLLIAEEDREALADAPAVFQVLGPRGDPSQVARRLFAALRVMDALGVSEIYARDFGETGLALAVRNRLIRAAGGNVIHV
ncbi:MAG: threonylcarbamoyl-AMP synthase, partial [Chloroflexi bacterium]